MLGKCVLRGAGHEAFLTFQRSHKPQAYGGDTLSTQFRLSVLSLVTEHHLRLLPLCRRQRWADPPQTGEGCFQARGFSANSAMILALHVEVLFLP